MRIAFSLMLALTVLSPAMAKPALDLTCTMQYKAVNPSADFKIFAGRDFIVDCKVTNLSDKATGGGTVKIIPPDEWTVRGDMAFQAIGPKQSVKGEFAIRAPARSTVRPKLFPVFAEMKLASGEIITRAFMVELADPFAPSLTIRSADTRSIKASISLRNLYPGQEMKGVTTYWYMGEGLTVSPGRQTFDFPTTTSFRLTYSKADQPGFALRAVTVGIKADEHIVRLRSVMEAVLPLGDGPTASGLWLNDSSDGKTLEATAGGKPCRQTVKNESGDTRYMYFAASPNFATGGKTYVVVTYFDGPAGSFGLQYDATDSPYKESGVIVRLAGTNQWKQKTFVLPDIGFTDRESGESDFRLVMNSTDLAVSDVAVSKFAQN